MYLLNIFLPLLSFFCAGCFGYLIGKKGAMLLTTTFLIFTTILAYFICWYTAFNGNFKYITLNTWISVDVFIVDWGFQFDILTSFMFCVVCTVSLLVHVYSCSYMSQDPHIPRFMSYLALFTFFMLLLVAADNFIVLFFGWEGVGICSYLLINFWFTRISANKAAIKAMVVNRIGDLGLLLGVLWVFELAQSVNFDVIFSLSAYINTYVFYWGFIKLNYLSISCLCLFVGSMGKSAQLTLHTWLPDAMEGPTPVSALIHAATMVTAGVFLIIRLSPIFEYAPLALNIITLIGALTALFGATVGLVQNDVKRVVAYSTSSQLGYMIFACGLSNYSASFYHLINHAFFKAALFLASGALIHGINDSQDIREMGGLASKMPYTFLTMVLGSFALAGLPFLSGAYSKDLILEIAYLQATTLGRLSFIFGIVAAFFTAAYSVRLIFLVFLRPPKANLVTNKLIFKTKIFYNKINFIHDVDNIIIIPLAILALGSVFSGTFLKEVFNYAHLNLFKQAIFILDNNLQPMVYSCIPNILKWVPAGTTILSILAITGLYLYKPLAINLFFKTYLGSRLYTFLINAWYFDLIYQKVFLVIFANLSFITYVIIDQGFIELLGPKGFLHLFANASTYFRNFYKGNIFEYIIAILGSVALFIALIL